MAALQQGLLGFYRELCGFPSYDAAGNFADGAEAAALNKLAAMDDR